MTTREPNVELAHDLVASNKVIGTNVYDAGGEHIGSVERLVLEKTSGRIAYAVLSFGGFLGIGTDYYPVPWEMLTYEDSLTGTKTMAGMRKAVRSTTTMGLAPTWDERWDESRNFGSVKTRRRAQHTLRRGCLQSRVAACLLRTVPFPGTPCWFGQNDILTSEHAPVTAENMVEAKHAHDRGPGVSVAPRRDVHRIRAYGPILGPCMKRQVPPRARAFVASGFSSLHSESRTHIPTIVPCMCRSAFSHTRSWTQLGLRCRKFVIDFEVLLEDATVDHPYQVPVEGFPRQPFRIRHRRVLHLDNDPGRCLYVGAVDFPVERYMAI